MTMCQLAVVAVWRNGRDESGTRKTAIHPSATIRVSLSNAKSGEKSSRPVDSTYTPSA